VLEDACSLKFEMPKEWVPEDWGIISHAFRKRKNTLQPVRESEGKKNHCIRIFSEDDFEMIKLTFVNRFGEEGKDLIALENIRMRWNQICTVKGVNQVPNSKPTNKANAEAARNIAAYEASLAEHKRRNEERAKTAKDFLARAKKELKAGDRKLSEAKLLIKILGELAVTSAATALLATVEKLSDKVVALHRLEKDPSKRDKKFAVLIEELESYKDDLAKVHVETEWAKKYNLARGRSELVVTETESQSLDDGNVGVANSTVSRKRKKLAIAMYTARMCRFVKASSGYAEIRRILSAVILYYKRSIEFTNNLKQTTNLSNSICTKWILL